MSRDKIKKARAASLTMSEQDRLEIKRLDSSPDETKTFEKAKPYNANFKGLTIGKAILQPGYVCEIDESCLTSHTFYMISGRMKLVMDDGTQDECGPGDVVMIPSGHNMSVIGNEPVIAIAFENYSK